MIDEVRRFPASADLLAQVDAILGAIPPDHRVAVVAAADLATGEMRLAVMYRLPAGFSFMGYLDKPYKGALTGGAELRWSR